MKTNRDKKGLTLLGAIAILGLCSLLFNPNMSQAATYYVDQGHPSASDANPGTEDSPWLTIQHASETMGAGDTVLIKNGVYNERVITSASGNATDGHIVFSNYPGHKPVIDGTGVTTGNNGFIVIHSYIKIIGLEIRNWNDNAIWIEHGAYLEISDCEVHHVGEGVGAIDGTHDCVFDRIVAHHFDLYGFDLSPGGGADCYNATFNDCLAHTGRDPEQNVDGFALGHGTQHDFVFNRCEAYGVYDGFDISSRNSTLNRCSAHQCSNGGYKLWQDNLRLVNCLSYDNGVSNVELDWDGDPGVTTLQNCTFFDSDSFNVWVENSNDSLHMHNCLVAGGDNNGLAFQQRNVSNYRGDYNIFHNDNPNRAINVGYEDEFSLDQIDAGDWTAYSGQDAHSIVVYTDTVLFVDPAAVDLHLADGSPAIDAGTTDGAPPDDYDGNPRDAAPDIGAYEYLGGGELNIITTTLPDGTVGTPYSQTLRATGGTRPYTWSIPQGSLPPGLELTANTGVISGTATTVGTYDFTVQVVDSAAPSDTDTQALSIRVLEEGGFTVSPSEGTIGTQITIMGPDLGDRKPKVWVGDKKCKVKEWSIMEILCLVKKRQDVGPHDVTVRPKGGDPIVEVGGFTMRAPEIDSMSQTSGSPGDEITVVGRFFGNKKAKPKVFFYFTNPDTGAQKKKKCKNVRGSLQWDATTGDSELSFLVPNVDPVTGRLVMENKIGAATISDTFTVQ